MGRVFSVFLLIVLVIGGVYLIRTHRDTASTSPVPNVYGQTSRQKIINDWFPEDVKNKNSDEINISAKSALIVDYESGEVQFAKESGERLSAASTIKIMTALVALEKSSLDAKFTVSRNAANVGENSMGLTVGEQLTLEELLYGMMLVSGNDAATTVAEGVGGSEQDFVRMMNDETKKLGLTDTKFVNASGLDVDGSEQYTTAHDMAAIAHYVWQNFSEFRKIASTYDKYIEQTDTHKDYQLYNDTNLLTSYPGVRGIKPGFTWDAGWCLVTYAQNNGKGLLGVILGSEDRRGEMVLLLDYAFAKYGIHVEHPGLDL